MSNNSFDLRASSLAGWSNCNLMSLCEQHPQLVEEQTGYALRKKQPHIATAMGSALHDAVRFALTNKTLDGAFDRARKKLHDEIKEEFIEDEVTKDITVAETQMQRMLEAWFPHSLTYDIAYTELNLGKPEKEGDPDMRVDLGATVATGSQQAITFLGSGHVDAITITPKLIDHKFGRNKPKGIVQYGFYSLLLKSKLGIHLKGIEEHWTPRRTINKPQPPTVITEYDVATAENLAWHVKEDVKRVITRFVDDGNPHAVPQNPSSMLCGEKWCPAWGTPICSSWKE